jgi:hypothetical protein
LVACVFDECSFWRDDTSASPDTETYSAILPSLATVNGLLVSISSAYRRAGLMYTKHRDFFGVDSDDTLVVSGTSQQFNPTLDAAVIAAQRAADPVAARSEWDSEFRADLATFIDDELIERARRSSDAGSSLIAGQNASHFAATPGELALNVQSCALAKTIRNAGWRGPAKCQRLQGNDRLAFLAKVPNV